MPYTPLREMRGFTLIELLAVVLVIILLAAVTLGVSGYVQKQMGITITKAQLAAIEAALESYKSDWGYYPRTFPERISSGGNRESLNNNRLINALCPSNSPVNIGRKFYMRFSAVQIRTNTWTQLPNVYDAWGKPFNYYNSPTTTFVVVPTNIANYGYTVGGQVNVTSYDLFSYGPDGSTFAITNTTVPTGWTVVWIRTNAAVDDITNWGR